MFHECRGLRARQPYLLVDSLAQIRPRYSLSRHRLTPYSAILLINLNNNDIHM